MRRTRKVICLSEPPAVHAPSRRILTLNYEYPPLGGGSSPVTAAICRELAAAGSDVDVVTMACRDLPRVERDGRVRIMRIPCLRSRLHICYPHELASYVVSAYFAARALLRQRRYDLVHAHFFFPSGVVAYLLHRTEGVPYAVTAHGSDVPGYNPDRFTWLHRVLRPLWRAVLGRSSGVSSPTQSLAELIRDSGSPPEPVAIIPNGIAADWAVPGDKEPMVLVAGRLFRRKGVQHVLQAIRRRPTSWEVHVVGDGPYRQALEAMVPDRTGVTFHGWLGNDTPEYRALYARASIFVMPSIVENFPIVLLEAMVTGCAILATDIPACREILGDAALYAAPGDADELSVLLHTLIEDHALRTDLGHRAHQRVLNRFTWDRVGKEYDAWFTDLLQPDR
ncbi:MAG: glycosyltransferase family 4 protein [Gemmatimonadetes bacterium]|nr:glycosyltransferase family 4 protein [Gemmatimonadota bacterium]